MSLWQLLRLLRNPHLHGSIPTADDSLAKAAHDIRDIGGPAPTGGFLSGKFPMTKSVHKHLAKGQKNYAKSFKKKG